MTISIDRQIAAVERKSECWAILCRSINQLDGDRSWFDGEVNGTTRTQLFPTRREALAFIKHHWSYVRHRSDLRREPHGWRMPKPVKVMVEVRLAP